MSISKVPTIPVRRIKDPYDRTVAVDESDEPLNSANEFDVTRLNIAKPGELYRVIWPWSNASLINRTIFTHQELIPLLQRFGHVDVIEQEDWCNYMRAIHRQLGDSQPWWLPILGRPFHKDGDFVDYRKEFHLSFARPSTDTSNNYEEPHQVLDEQARNRIQSDKFSSAIASPMNGTLRVRRARVPLARSSD